MGGTIGGLSEKKFFGGMAILCGLAVVPMWVGFVLLRKVVGVAMDFFYM